VGCGEAAHDAGAGETRGSTFSQPASASARGEGRAEACAIACAPREKARDGSKAVGDEASLVQRASRA
jgi:hypothetical protein